MTAYLIHFKGGATMIRNSETKGEAWKFARKIRPGLAIEQIDEYVVGKGWTASPDIIASQTP